MRRLVIPKSFSINGLEWHVFTDKTAPRDLKDKLRAEDLGVCVYSARAIILASWQTEDEMEETFFHEVLHVLLEDDEWLGSELEHHVIQTIEAPLTRLMRQLVYKEVP